MLKSFIVLLIFVLLLGCQSQKDSIEKVSLHFRYFKYPNSEYQVDFKKREMTVHSYYLAERDTFFALKKKYTFTKKESVQLKKEFSQDVPDTVVAKGESGLDGGGFTITYFRKDNRISKLKVSNPLFNKSKYKKELGKIDTFFDFAYAVVKDTSGINALDLSYRPNFDGLPVRKISDSPLEYKIWGSIWGDASTNPEFINFLNGLPQDKCVIINCSGNLSYALEEDMLRLYTIKNSNLKFANIKNSRHISLDEMRKSCE